MNGWDSAVGGIQTVNRELAAAVARVAPDLLCSVIVPLATPQEIEDAFSKGVELISGTRSGDWAGAFLSSQVRSATAADVLAVVGHSYFSGEEAQQLRNNLFPSALSVQFVHTSPLHVESVKEYKQDSYVKDREQKITKEVSIANGADLVVCIGPRLHRAMHDLLAARNRPGETIRAINCGLSRRSDLFREPPMRPTLLCLGRTESIGVKGLDIFAYAAGYLSQSWAQHPSTRERPPPQFIVRGVQGDEEDFERRLIALAEDVGTRPILIARPYTATREELVADYRGATAFLMPSREEGYGLVACEALSLGVPTLVSENSGIAEVIREVALAHHMDAAHCVIPMTGAAKVSGRRFADAALEILVHAERATSYCNMLSERLLTSCSWEVGAQQFLAAVDGAVRNATQRAVDSRPLTAPPTPGESRPTSVVKENLSSLMAYSGALGVSIQQAIVVTFERGQIPNDLPAEIDGIPVIAREGDPLQATSTESGSIGELFLDGIPTASIGLFVRDKDGNFLALTAAHALDQRPFTDLRVRVGTKNVAAIVALIDRENDFALLKLAEVGSLPEVKILDDPTLGQTVRVQISDAMIPGTVTALEVSSTIITPGAQNHRSNGLFEVSTKLDIPAGSSGALVLSDEGYALGMLVARSQAQGEGSGATRVFAIPLRRLAAALNVSLLGSQSQPEKGPVGILTTDEGSLREVLGSIQEVERFVRQGRSYFKGRLSADGPTITIAPVPRVGNIGAAIATMALVLDNDVTQIFVIGICGGLDPKRQTLADVVVASDVIYYEPGIVGPDGDRQRFRLSGTAPNSSIAAARALAAASSDPTKGRPLGIHIGGIASGEKIIKTKNGLAKALSEWSNIIAVEMEGAGVSEAAASIGNIPVTIVRGISDFADSSKTDDVRGEATANAVAVALELIRRSAPLSAAFDLTA